MNKEDSADSTKQDEKTSLVECVTLRAVKEDDLIAFFEMQLTPMANQVAAFTAKDPSDKDAFMLPLKVLEKSGFNICGYDRGFSNSRGEEVDEVVFSL